jgi:gas vesicle protein
VKAEGTGRGVVTNQFFLVGVLVGSACGLVVGSALGFELRPDRIKALKKMMRRLTGQDDRPRFDLMV